MTPLAFLEASLIVATHSVRENLICAVPDPLPRLRGFFFLPFALGVVGAADAVAPNMTRANSAANLSTSFDFLGGIVAENLNLC